MFNQHVTTEEWQLFFINNHSTQNDPSVRSRVLTHVMACPDCRAFYDKANNLSQAASAYAAALRGQEEEDGYAAVASFAQPAAKAAASHTFTVDIDSDGSKAVFLNDTVEATGAARKYAVNTEQDGTCLQEDGDAFTLTLEGSTLHIRVESALQGKVSATLRSFDQEQQITFTGCEAAASMPDDDIYILELTFA